MASWAGGTTGGSVQNSWMGPQWCQQILHHLWWSRVNNFAQSLPTCMLFALLIESLGLLCLLSRRKPTHQRFIKSHHCGCSGQHAVISEAILLKLNNYFVFQVWTCAQILFQSILFFSIEYVCYPIHRIYKWALKYS